MKKGWKSGALHLLKMGNLVYGLPMPAPKPIFLAKAYFGKGNPLPLQNQDTEISDPVGLVW